MIRRCLNADTPGARFRLVVLDDHVAQLGPDVPADARGIVMAVLHLALAAALVIVTQVRKPAQDDGVTRRGLHERSYATNPRVNPNVGKTSQMAALTTLL